MSKGLAQTSKAAGTNDLDPRFSPTGANLIFTNTDNTGTDAINLPLSERRAQSVADATVAQGVSSSRITTKGLGSSDPVGDNSTVEGKQANRRVEIAIFANEKMKKAAENGNL